MPAEPFSIGESINAVLIKAPSIIEDTIPEALSFKTTPSQTVKISDHITALFVNAIHENVNLTTSTTEAVLEESNIFPEIILPILAIAFPIMIIFYFLRKKTNKYSYKFQT